MHYIFEHRIILFILIGLMLLSCLIYIIRCLCRRPIDRSKIYPNTVYINPLQVKKGII